MIIDSLTHVTPDGHWFSTSYDASEDRLLREMDKAEVDKAVVVALAGYIENDFVAQVCARHPDRLIPGASINPVAYSTPEQAAIAAKALLSDGRFAILKLHPRLNGYDPLDPRCLAVLEEVSSFSKPIPIWLDTLFRNKGCLLTKPPVDTIQELAWRFNGLYFVLLHGGGSLLLQIAELVGEYPNLTIDLSLTLLYYEHSSLEQDVAFVLGRRDRRTIVGSDFPEFTPSEHVNAVRRITSSAGLLEVKATRVLGANLHAMLG